MVGSNPTQSNFLKSFLFKLYIMEKSEMKRERGHYKIGSVEHAFQVVEQLSTGKKGVTEIAKTLELQKNKVFRVLATLSSIGLVDFEADTEKYFLSSKFKSLFGNIESQEKAEITKLANKILNTVA